MNKTKFMKIIAPIALLVCALIWGFAFVVVKQSLDTVPPFYMMAFRFSIAALFLSLIFIPKMKKITKKSWLRGLIVGFLLFMAYAFQTVGCKYTSAGNNAFLTAVYVILVPIIGAMFFRKRAGVVTYFCGIIAVVGIGLICLGGAITFNLGDALTLACSIFYAVHIIFLSDFTQKDDVCALTALQFVFAAAFSWLAAPIFDGKMPSLYIIVRSSSGIVSLLYLGIMSSAISFLLQSFGQKYTSSSTSAILLCTESVFGALFGVLYLSEKMTGAAIIGCAIMFIAIVISETKLSFIPKVGDFLVKIEGADEKKDPPPREEQPENK